VAAAQRCINQTIATDASASASVAMTAAKVRGPKANPPTSLGSMIPSNPAEPSAATASDENRASLSFCLAAGARM